MFLNTQTPMFFRPEIFDIFNDSLDQKYQQEITTKLETRTQQITLNNKVIAERINYAVLLTRKAFHTIQYKPQSTLENEHKYFT